MAKGFGWVHFHCPSVFLAWTCWVRLGNVCCFSAPHSSICVCPWCLVCISSRIKLRYNERSPAKHGVEKGRFLLTCKIFLCYPGDFTRHLPSLSPNLSSCEQELIPFHSSWRRRLNRAWQLANRGPSPPCLLQSIPTGPIWTAPDETVSLTCSQWRVLRMRQVWITPSLVLEKGFLTQFKHQISVICTSPACSTALHLGSSKTLWIE